MASFGDQSDMTSPPVQYQSQSAISPIQGHNPWRISEKGSSALSGIEYMTKVLQSDCDPVICEMLENRETLDRAFDSLTESRGAIPWSELEWDFTMAGPQSTKVSNTPPVAVEALPTELPNESMVTETLHSQFTLEAVSVPMTTLSIEVPKSEASKYATGNGFGKQTRESVVGKTNKTGRPPTREQLKRRMYDTTRSAVGGLVVFLREIPRTVGTFKTLYQTIYQYLQFICSCPDLRAFLNQNEEYVRVQIPVFPGEQLDYADLWKSNKLYLRALTSLRKDSGRSWSRSVDASNGRSWFAHKRHLEGEVGRLWEQAMTHMRYSDPSFYWDRGPGAHGLMKRVLPKRQ